MRVLVTGGLGFVGYAVTHALAAANHDVTVLTRPSTSALPLPESVQLVRADITDLDGLRRSLDGYQFDGVCHLAALARVRESFERPLDYFDTNVGGTGNLLRALSDLGTTPAAFVLASTGAVYGSDATGALSEDHPVNPSTPYAASKRAAEQLVEYYARTGAVGACILRTFSISGAFNGVTDGDDSRIITKALRVAAGLSPEIDVNGDGSAFANPPTSATWPMPTGAAWRPHNAASFASTTWEPAPASRSTM